MAERTEAKRIERVENKIKMLAETLQGINEGTISDEDARRILSGIDPVELSLAEQELLERGVDPQELRRLCEVHLRALEREVEDLKGRAGAGHPLYTLISEHELILGFLDSLEAATGRLWESDSYTPGDKDSDKDIELVEELARHLVETEKHHRREEDALFPALESRGITGPTRVMRIEHEEMRPKKQELLELVRRVNSMDYEEFKHRLREIASFIVFHLRDHIFKENTILYPAAYRAIREPGAWSQIARKCDEIGYCCFTPGATAGEGERAPGGHMVHSCCISMI
ncbi:MAG: DUF438 domain-containing protein [Firmicutes bacterium]|nr:DUF438 domain-containing protein [Bacillota bacterium]